MKIGINGQRLLTDKPAGPEIYTLNIIRSLAKIDTENTYIVYFDKEPSPKFFDNLTCSNPNFSYVVIKKFLSWTQLGLACELIFFPVDVFFTAVHTLPILRLPWLKVVSMIHGLEYVYSAEYANPLFKWWLSKPIWFAATFSNAIIVPSQFTKSELLKHDWGSIFNELFFLFTKRVANKKIHIINEGVNDLFYKRSGEDIKKLREKYNLGDSLYLLFVSTIQPRKNIPLMVKGFSLALKELEAFKNKPELKNAKLLIAGKLGWLYKESLDAPQKYGVKGSVLFLGRTEDSELPILLSGAVGFVNTSFEEGFGLPLLEAMACETKCLVSDIPAFREVGGEIPLYVNPKDTEDIKAGFIKLLTSDVDAELCKKTKERAMLFSWDTTAKKTLQVLQGIKLS